MYNILKNYLENAEYTLEDAQGRIDYHVARGNITPEQAAALSSIAEARAMEDPPDMTDRVAALEETVVALEETVGGLVREEIVPSDKAGQLWRNTYVGDLLAKQEYIPDPNVEGTEGNPIPWESELPLITNGFYIHEDVRKVWTGESGATAAWDAPGWEVF